VAGDDAHVLAFVDLDPPAAIGPLLHWLAALPSDVDTLTANDSSSASVAPYLGPNPPPGTGLHRYVFFLLNNPSDEFALPPGYGGLTNGTEARFNFSIDAFMEAGGFTLAAANYFTAENTTATNSTNSTQSPSATPSPSATAPPPDSGALGNVAGLQSAFALGGAFMALSYFL
jgi:hypothetical protein